MTDISEVVKFSCNHQNIDCSNKVHKIARDKLLFTYPCESTTECFPYRVILLPGLYRFDLYGAQGGDGRQLNIATKNENSGGKGAHVSGKLRISVPNQTFYFYIGGKGEDQLDEGITTVSRGGYNGGGNGGNDIHQNEYLSHESSAGGGGATDIRLIYSETYDDDESLKSRIAVAAGGGGAVSDSTSECNISSNLDSPYLCNNYDFQYDFRGGPGGKLFGYTYNPFTFPPNQTFGNFGRGSDGINISKPPGGSIGGSGGGYYGGTCISNETIQEAYEGGGSGGSSYISGYEGCISVKNHTISENKYGLHIHYSNIVFSHPVMHSGLELFEDESGNIIKGHSNSGSILITCLNNCCITKTSSYNPRIQFFILSLSVMLYK